LNVPEEVQPESVRSRRRSASIDRVNNQPEAAKRPATVPVIERPRPAKKVVAKKRAAKKAPAKKAPVKKVAAKKAPAKKAVARPAKKVAARGRQEIARRREEQQRIEKLRAEINAVVNGPLGDEDRQRLIRTYEQRQEVLRNRAADISNNFDAAIVNREASIYKDAVRDLRNPNPPEPADRVSAPRPAKKVAAKKRAARANNGLQRLEDLNLEDRRKVESELNRRYDAAYIATVNRRIAQGGRELDGFIEAHEGRIVSLKAKRDNPELPMVDRVAAAENIRIIDADIRRMKKARGDGPERPATPQPPVKKVAAKKRAARRRDLPGLSALDEEPRIRVQADIQGIYGNEKDQKDFDNQMIEIYNSDQLKEKLLQLEADFIPRELAKANDNNRNLADRVFSVEAVAVLRKRADRLRVGIAEKQRAAENGVPNTSKAPDGGLSPDKIAKLEKDMAKRYANLRKKRGGIVGAWMIKTYGNEDPPPWKTDKNIKIDELLRLTRGDAADKTRVKEWVKQVYAIDEVVGRNGLRFRVQIQDEDIQASGGRISFAGSVQAFNTDTNEWENVGKTVRTLNVSQALVGNDKLMIGAKGGYNNPFANGARNEGFTSVYNPHAFTWLKASGFERANVGAIGDGRFVWGRYGFRQEMVDLGRGRRLADNLMEEVKKYRDGERNGLIRTDLDADLIEYLTSVAKQKNFSIDAPQHPEYILALAGDKNFTEAEKVAYDQKLQEWFVNVSPFGTGVYDFNDQNVPDDPRKLV